MAFQKPQGEQLDIQSVAADIAADPTAIGDIATGVTSDPGAAATLDADYIRVDGTNEPGVALFTNDANYQGQVVPGTVGDFAALDASGNIIDGGVQASDLATAAQGTLADSALQNGDNVTELVNDANYTTDAGVAVNHYTKTENDGTAGSAGAKTDKVSGAVNGNFAGLDASGNLTDSGSTASTFATSAQGLLADSALQDITGESIGDLSDVATGSPSDKMVLVWDGITDNRWEARLLVAGDINSGTFADALVASSNVTQHEGDLTIAMDQISEAATPVARQVIIGSAAPIWEQRLLVEADISDLGTYEPAFTKNTAFNKNFGTATGDVCQGDDSRVNNGQTAFGWGDHALANYQGQVVPATVGDFAALDASGNIVDGGAQASDFATSAQGTTADSATQPGDNVSTLTNDANYTTDATVATNHYTKTEADATTPAAGAKVDKVAGVSGNVVEFGASNAIADSGVATSALAPVASPTFTGVPTLPSYVKASLPAVGSGGGMIYVSDATGASVTGSMCFSNGTSWIDVTTGIAVA